MEFFETVGGKQFYFSTMPEIAKNLGIIANIMTQQINTEKYIVVRSYNFNHNIELVKRIKSNEIISVFNSQADAQELMHDDLIAHFNSNGWEDDIVPDIDEIRKRNYFITDEPMHMSLSSNEPADNADTIYWTIIKL